MTLVIDACAVAELLLGTEAGRRVGDAIADHALLAPGLLAVEVLSVLRGWLRAGRIDPTRAEVAIEDFRALGVELVDMEALLPAAWQLRDRASAYDAVYVALAEAVGAKLLTCDARLAREFSGVTFVP